MKTASKKIISVMLAALTVISMLCVGAFAAPEWEFAVNEFGYAVLVSCPTDTEGAVEIPAKVTIDGKELEVKTVGVGAFSGCALITEITVPEGVTQIFSKAFENCTALKTVNLPSTLVNCQYDAFEGCGNITVNCYKASFQFFAVYGFSDNIYVNIIDGKMDEDETRKFNSIIDFIKYIILKILSFFGIVKA